MRRMMSCILALLLMAFLLPGHTVFAQEPGETDQQAADRVAQQIRDLGEITLDSQDAITAAQLAYAKLTPEQRALVPNFADLTAAHTRLQTLQHEYAQTHAQQRQITLQNIRLGLMIFGAVAALSAGAFWFWRYFHRKKGQKPD